MTVEWMEITGLFLVLASSFIKIFLADGIEALHAATLQYRAERKLDYIYQLLFHHHRKQVPEDNKVFSTWMNLDEIEKQWKDADPNTIAGRQAKGFRSKEASLFIMGSLLLILSKALPFLMPNTFPSHSLTDGDIATIKVIISKQ